MLDETDLTMSSMPITTLQCTLIYIDINKWLNWDEEKKRIIKHYYSIYPYYSLYYFGSVRSGWCVLAFIFLFHLSLSHQSYWMWIIRLVLPICRKFVKVNRLFDAVLSPSPFFKPSHNLYQSKEIESFLVSFNFRMLLISCRIVVAFTLSYHRRFRLLLLLRSNGIGIFMFATIHTLSLAFSHAPIVSSECVHVSN